MSLKKLLLLPLLLFLFSCVEKESNDNGLNDPKPNEVIHPPFNITSTGYFTCARFHQKIKCWGHNNGRLGLGSILDLGATQASIDSIAYVNLGDNFKTIDLKSGVNHTCALSASGDVKCWGYSREGFLGKEGVNLIGTAADQMGNSLLKIELGDDFTVTKLFEGGNCAQIQSGDVKCWGDNDYGQLGLGNTDDRGLDTNTMGNNLPEIDLGQTFDVKKIISTSSNACALNQSGDMKCWGGKDTGITGASYSNHVGDEANEMGSFLRTMDLGSGFTVSDFDLVNSHVCALSTAGKLKCWGYNIFGQLGQDHTNTLGKVAGELGDNLAEIKLGFTVKQVKVGGAHTCALSTEGKVLCWGRNFDGQLGYGDTTHRGTETSLMKNLSNVELGNDFTAISIELGAKHSCAISSKYEVKCWGRSINKEVLTGAAGDHAGDQANEMGNNLKSMVLFKN